MAFQINITPSAAADAGCAGFATQVASGSIPLDPSYAGEGAEASGTWIQYNFDAIAAAFWLTPLTCHVFYEIEETITQSPSYEPETITRTHDVYAAHGTRAPVDDDFWADNANPYIEYNAVYKLFDANDGHLIAQLTRVKRITKIVFTFARNLPHGSIFCNQSGVMVCNSAGSLLWN